MIIVNIKFSNIFSPFLAFQHSSADNQIIGEKEEICNKKGSDHMLSDEKKKDIRETVEMLIMLDQSSLTIIKSNTEVLKARDMLEKEKQTA